MAGFPLHGARTKLLVALSAAALWGAAFSCGLDRAGTSTSSNAAVEPASGDGTDVVDASAPSVATSEAPPPRIPGQDAAPLDAALVCPDSGTACGEACVQASTDVQNCGTCAHVCPGTKRACTEGACSATVHVKAYIDGTATLEIKGSTARWIAWLDAAPGRWSGHDDPTTLDGVAYKPFTAAGELRSDGGANDPSGPMTVPKLATRPQTVTLANKVLRGQATVDVSQVDGGAVHVTFADKAGSAAFAEVDVLYETD